ncbi:sperm flagellar protein 1-like isoform X2 [Prorops nasuta]|uniref:sperm flagellar protein 1-like isoform X2 n=1 Tax=Prorops nasuta TaxID=863751 RepID=UPI0034CD5224
MIDIMEKNNGDGLENLHAWVDAAINQKTKRLLIKDFSDGVLVAEILKVYYPRYVDLHNYVPANSLQMKMDNWNTLNWKVFTKINMKLSRETISQLANGNQTAIESLLQELKVKVERSTPSETNNNLSDQLQGKEENVESVESTKRKSIFQNFKQYLNSYFNWVIYSILGSVTGLFKPAQTLEKVI